jgi:hypothetical protein
MKYWEQKSRKKQEVNKEQVYGKKGKRRGTKKSEIIKKNNMAEK